MNLDKAKQAEVRNSSSANLTGLLHTEISNGPKTANRFVPGTQYNNKE